MQTTVISYVETPEICIICLDRVSERATAIPCRHDHFHLSCLGTWLQQQQKCPLCKLQINAVCYLSEQCQQQQDVFWIPILNLSSPPEDTSVTPQYHHPNNSHIEYGHNSNAKVDADVSFRRQIYQQKLYSKRVGTNRISHYRNVNPTTFLQDEQLVQRARKWLRRELSVFGFLNPSSTSLSSTNRQATTAEYLLEYTVAILKTIDIRGSSGQAQELLKEHLGRENAKILLHELECWLRSPFEKLEEWDEAVQYTAI